MTEIVWTVEIPGPAGEESTQVAWCSTAVRAREVVAKHWRDVRATEWIAIYPRRLDTTDFKADGFSFVGDPDDAVEAGWLGADGLLVEEVPEPGESVEAPVVVVSEEAPSIWG